MTEQTATRIVVTEWQQSYIRWLECNVRSPRTAAAYLQDLRLFDHWYSNHFKQPFKPEHFCTSDVRAYQEYSQKVQKVSPATWNRRRISLRTLNRFLTEQFGVISANWKMLRELKNEQIAPRWLEKSDWSALERELDRQINAANTSLRRWRAIRDRALIVMMRYCGLRVEEVASLRMGNVEISARKGWLTVTGKGNKTRGIPMGLAARTALGAWLEIRPADGAASDDCVFLGNNRAPITTRSIQILTAEMGSRAGITDLTPHMLRHTFAKSILDAGHPITEVQALLGHEDLKTTMRYVMPGRADLAGAVEDGETGITFQELRHANHAR